MKKVSPIIQCSMIKLNKKISWYFFARNLVKLETSCTVIRVVNMSSSELILDNIDLPLT